MVIQAFPALPNLVNAEKQGTGLLGHFFLQQIEHFILLGHHVN
jgi:hypothetical protein